MVAYISLPITGTNDFLARSLDAEFNIAERFKVKEIVNPCNCWRSLSWQFKYVFMMLTSSTDDKCHKHYMEDDIRKMLKCDTVFFLKGWQLSKGCRIKHKIAKEYGMRIFYENNQNWSTDEN